jgi:transposase-like protein
MFLFTGNKRGISSCQLAKALGVKQHTAWFMLQRLRLALKDENEIILGGIVQADESFVGPKINRDLRLRIARQKHEEEQNKLHGYGRRKKRKIEGKQKRGRKRGSTKEVLQEKALERGNKPYKSNTSYRMPFEKGAVILGMIEPGGKMVMKKLGTNSKCVTMENIYPLLKKHISPDSVLITDQLNLYNGTSQLFAEHKTVNHERGYVIDGVHTNSIENAWKHLKKLIEGTYFHLSYQHFDGYLNENTYRWNRRKENQKYLFEDFMPLTIVGKTSYKELIKKDESQQAA